MNNWERALLILTIIVFGFYFMRMEQIEHSIHAKLGYVGRVLGAQERVLIQLKEKDWGCIR